MSGSKVSYTRADAATACLLMLALIVGPLCTPLCAGSSCLTQSTSSAVKASCHGMSSSHGDNHFAASARGGPCRLAEARLAILIKSTLSVKTTSFEDGESIVAAAHSDAQDVFAVSSHFIFSSGGPLGICGSTFTNLVLRI